MNKKISLFLGTSLFIFLSIFVLGNSLPTHIVGAQEDDSGPGGGESGGTPQAGLSHVFGWVWGGTNEGMSSTVTAPNSGIGWIKLNKCDDANSDGQPDNSSCLTDWWGVQVEMTTGKMSGYGWSSNVGWVSFDASEAGIPPDGQTGSTLARINVTPGINEGEVKGWARVLSAKADETDGWDGWIHLSDTDSDPSLHPAGRDYKSGNAGVTYDEDAGTIVGYAWGSDVVGWVRFVSVTLGVPTLPFNYSLTSSGANSIVVGGSAKRTITRTHVAGVREKVSVVVESIAPLDSGIRNPGIGWSVPMDNGCYPSCANDITFTTLTTTPPGRYRVVVRGQSAITNIQKTTTFDLTVVGPTTGSLSVSCLVGSLPPYLINKPVTWKAVVLQGPTVGEAPYTIEWEFISENELGSTASGEGEQSDPVFPISKTYSKIGRKHVKAIVTDSSEPALTGECTSEAINVVVETNIKQK